MWPEKADLTRQDRYDQRPDQKWPERADLAWPDLQFAVGQCSATSAAWPEKGRKWLKTQSAVSSTRGPTVADLKLLYRNGKNAVSALEDSRSTIKYENSSNVDTERVETGKYHLSLRQYALGEGLRVPMQQKWQSVCIPIHIMLPLLPEIQKTAAVLVCTKATSQNTGGGYVKSLKRDISFGTGIAADLRRREHTNLYREYRQTCSALDPLDTVENSQSTLCDEYKYSPKQMNTIQNARYINGMHIATPPRCYLLTYGSHRGVTVWKRLLQQCSRGKVSHSVRYHFAQAPIEAILLWKPLKCLYRDLSYDQISLVAPEANGPMAAI